MTDQRRTFRVTIEEGQATAEAGGVQLGQTTVDASPLRRKTIKLLQDWLARWGTMTWLADTDPKRFQRLPVPETFEVLGDQLYEMVFGGEQDGSVGAAFEAEYGEAQRKGEKLQVILTFQPSARELAPLPWEFLHRPQRPGSEGYYLGTTVELIRFVPLEQSVPLSQADPPLRILFVMTVPSRSIAYDKERSELTSMMAEFPSDPDLDDRIRARFVRDWDEGSVRQELRRRPHVIHVVGVCRNDGERIKVARTPERDPDGARADAGERVEETWVDQDMLVGLLTMRPAGDGEVAEDYRPSLVVLHLIEPNPIDFTATFERLAPVLIAARIPAVLAMQYPIPVRAAKKFVNAFYAELAVGNEIGKAVQQAREEFFNAGRYDRLFGTPVLYMQSVDGQLVKSSGVGSSLQRQQPVSAGPQPSTRRGDGLAASLRELGPKIQAKNPELGSWVATERWPADPAEARGLILLKMQTDTEAGQNWHIYEELLGRVRRAEESR